MAKTNRSLSLEEFKSEGQPDEVIEFLSKISTEGSLLACHALVFETTGTWIPELVGTFTRLDALVAAKRK